MHPGKQKAHKITTVIKKKGLWNIRLEKQEMQVSFLFKKKKTKKKLPNHKLLNIC